MIGKLLAWLETRLYGENYYEADAERTILRIRVSELEDEIRYLSEMLDGMGGGYHVRY